MNLLLISDFNIPLIYFFFLIRKFFNQAHTKALTHGEALDKGHNVISGRASVLSAIAKEE